MRAKFPTVSFLSFIVCAIFSFSIVYYHIVMKTYIVIVTGKLSCSWSSQCFRQFFPINLLTRYKMFRQSCVNSHSADLLKHICAESIDKTSEDACAPPSNRNFGTLMPHSFVIISSKKCGWSQTFTSISKSPVLTD